MMKQLLCTLISLLSFSLAFAGEGDQFVNVNAGFLFNSTLNASIGYEQELPYGNAVELYGEIGNHFHSEDGKYYKDTFWKDYYWDGGLLYKQAIKRFKNSILRFRIGPQFGSHKGDYFFGSEGGFEYNYIFQNGVQFSVIQKNQVNFLHGDTFRNGLMIGFKIPL